MFRQDVLAAMDTAAAKLDLALTQLNDEREWLSRQPERSVADDPEYLRCTTYSRLNEIDEASQVLKRALDA